MGASVKTGTRVQLGVFPEGGSHRIVGRNAVVIAVLVDCHDDLTVQFTFKFVWAAYIGWQLNLGFLITCSQEIVGFSNFFEPRTRGEVKAQFQIKNGADSVRFFDFCFCVTVACPFVRS